MQNLGNTSWPSVKRKINDSKLMIHIVDGSYSGNYKIGPLSYLLAVLKTGYGFCNMSYNRICSSKHLYKGFTV